MQKTILITGSTDGIGLETARLLVSLGHTVLLHGRNRAKLEQVKTSLSGLPGSDRMESYVADFSTMTDVKALATKVKDRHNHLDVLINNAGVFKVADPTTRDGLDIRFAVNTFAPFLLTRELIKILGTSSRVINLSSAAQLPVDPEALTGQVTLSDDYAAYAQSKLALTMWSRALSLGDNAPMVVAVNPGSLLGSKMVRKGFGVTGRDIQIGAEILAEAALSNRFKSASGQYFDNDSGQFADPHPDALDTQKINGIVRSMEQVLAELIR